MPLGTQVCSYAGHSLLVSSIGVAQDDLQQSEYAASRWSSGEWL